MIFDGEVVYMSDLVCKDTTQYQSIAPVNKPVVCSAKNNKEELNYTPISRDKCVITDTPAGKVAPEYSFNESETLTCEMPKKSVSLPHLKKIKASVKKPASAELNMCIDPRYILDKNAEEISPALFTSNLENSHIVAEMYLDLTDTNGFNNRGQNDITGRITSGNIDVNHELFDKSLYDLKGSVTNEGNRTTTIKNVTFNNKEKAYIFDIKLEQKVLKIPFKDNFLVKFQINNQGQLITKLDDNWIPDSLILNKLKEVIWNKINEKIPQQYRNISLDVIKQGKQLKIIPKVDNLNIPVSTEGALTINNIDGDKAKFNIDDRGNFHINLSSVKITGSSTQDPNARNIPANKTSKDSASIELKVGIGKDNSKQVYAKGNLDINLDENETKNINLDNETLSNYFQSGKIINNFSVYINQKQNEKPNVKSKNSVSVRDAKLGDQTVDLATSLKLDFDSKHGIQLSTVSPEYTPLNLNTSKNGVELFINGQEYFPEMKDMIKKAKNAIDLETYNLHDDSTGKEIAYLLAKKAAGLDIGNKTIIPDLKAKNGVKVKLLFNSWKGQPDDGEKSEQVMYEARKRVEEEIDKSNLSPSQKQNAKQRLHNNLQWKFFTEGILRSDHRKVFVVDGSQATVGGMNMGNKYLSNDSYHDVMLKVAGPEVRNIHKEFLENWFEFNNLPQPTREEWNKLLKSKQELTKELSALQAKGKYKSTANTATLVTDDRQIDIEKGIIKLIDEAKNEINIEQAFFSNPKINKHLSEAIKRGVTINVIIAENSIIKIFDYANLDSVYNLVKAKNQGAPGDIKLFYYNNDKGTETKYIHTKAITVDNQKGIIGSANMIGRSLASPFIKIDKQNNYSQALYNKELSLYIEDPDFVDDINSRLFKKDMKQNCKELNIKDIEKRVQEAGGEEELKKKALMATLS